MKLYDCATAPSPRKVRMFLAEKGVQLATVAVDLGGGEHRHPAFTAVNPKQTVPVLELDDGTSLSDVGSIFLYLEEAYPDPNLLGATMTERAVIHMWQRAMENDGYSAVVECFRNTSKGFRGRALTGPVDFKQIPELADRGRARVRDFFRQLNERFSENEFVSGNRFTAADISGFVAVEFARAIREEPSDAEVHLKRWRDAIRTRASSSA